VSVRKIFYNSLPSECGWLLADALSSVEGSLDVSADLSYLG
jgi:hypothetical protein